MQPKDVTPYRQLKCRDVWSLVFEYSPNAVRWRVWATLSMEAAILQIGAIISQYAFEECAKLEGCSQKLSDD